MEDSDRWVERLRPILEAHSAADVEVVTTYEDGERVLASTNIDEYDLAVIDVQLREQAYDQGGLALLDIAKEARSDLPVLILTAFASDHRGIGEIISRYCRVQAYDKDDFMQAHSNILTSLLTELPPQLGEPTTNDPVSISPGPSPRASAGGEGRWVVLGGAVVAMILMSAALFFRLSKSCPTYPTELHVVFSLVVIAIIAVLLKVFGERIIDKAVGLWKKTFGE